MASLILPGTKIGDFSGNLVKGDGQSTALWTSDNIDEEYILLCFFPMINAVDSTEVNAIKENMDKLNELKCKILGVTDEGIPSVKNWINLSPSSGGFGGPVGFDIICDKGMAVANKFGAKTSSGEPARYVGRNFSSLLNTLTAIQTIDSDDVIIPAGWKPADKTIKNTPDGIYDYYGISGNTITTGSLVQSEKAKSSVKYSESGVDVLEPALPNEDPSMTTSKKSSSRASPAVITPAPAPPSSAKSSKSSTTKASSLKSPKPSSIKEASVKSESSKTPSRLGSDRGLEVASVGSKKESSHPSQSPSTPSKPASSAGKVSSKDESKIPVPKSKSPSLPSTKTTSLSSASSKTTTGESKKSIYLTIDGKKMKCDCTITSVPKPTEKKLNCDCVEINSQSPQSMSIGEKISVKSKKKYRIE